MHLRAPAQHSPTQRWPLRKPFDITSKPLKSLRPGCCRLQIDRRRHTELALERALTYEQTCSTRPVPGHVLEVATLRHLECVLEDAGSAVLVLCLYSKSCGGCKEVLTGLSNLAADFARERAGVLCLQHDCYSEFDFLTELARCYRHPHKRGPLLPSFVLFLEGAVLKRMSMADLRSLGGPPAAIQQYRMREQARLQTALRQVLWSSTPSARR